MKIMTGEQIDRLPRYVRNEILGLRTYVKQLERVLAKEEEEVAKVRELIEAVSQAVCVVKLLPDGHCVLMKDDLDRLRALLDEVQGGRIETTETLYTR